MIDTLLTPASALKIRLAAAQARERQARAEQMRLKREMLAMDRRRETQLLCTLGRAWLALGDRSAGFRESGAKFLSGYITRQADRDVLVGTAWALPESVADTPAPATINGGDHT